MLSGSWDMGAGLVEVYHIYSQGPTSGFIERLLEEFSNLLFVLSGHD